MPPKAKKPLSSADREVWEDVTRSVEPLDAHERRRRPAAAVKGDDGANSSKKTPPSPPSPRVKKKRVVAPDNFGSKRRGSPPPPPTPIPGLIDRRGQRKIARGQMPIDSTIDLHGLTQDQAYARLSRHLEAASNAGERCILVITGKGGEKGEGVLRRSLPDWLGNRVLGDLVSAISPAGRSHGGSGAFYVRLRNRNKRK